MTKPSGPFPIELITWNTLHRLTRQVSLQITAAGYVPDIVVAIARGGYVPSRIICDFLGVSILTDIRVVHYGAGAEEKNAKLAAPLGIDVRNKKVLLVDDLTDQGTTMRIALDHIKEMGPKSIRAAVLLHKKKSEILPDYYAKKITKWRWVIFPWAAIEDLSAFIRQMQRPPLSPSEARNMFQRDYHTNIPLAVLRDIYSLHSFIKTGD